MNETDGAAERLCLLLGMIMEDMSVIELLASQQDQIGRRATALEQAGRDIVSLAQAVAVIVRRWPSSTNRRTGKRGSPSSQVDSHSSCESLPDLTGLIANLRARLGAQKPVRALFRLSIS